MVSHQYILFKRISLLAMLLAWCVVVFGAYVRLTDAGLGCPDWPGCYGTMIVPEGEQAVKAAEQAYPNKPVDSGRAWREMIHRYLAGTLGILVLAMFVFSVKLKKHINASLGLLTTLLILVGLQALLGMLTVTMLLRPAIVTTHLFGGMCTLGLITWITHRHCGYASGAVIRYPATPFKLRIGLLILIIQIVLGGWTSTNYAALACTDFPTCHGSMWPAMDYAEGFNVFRLLGLSSDGSPITLEALTAIQWTHRIGALVTFLYLAWMGKSLIQYWQIRRLAILMMCLLLLQVVIGVGNLVMQLPIVLAVSHNAVAALMLVVLVIINSKVTQKNKII